MRLRKPSPEQLAMLRSFRLDPRSPSRETDLDFRGLDLCGLELEEAFAYRVAFDGTLLRQAKLYGSHFDGASFCQADLTDSDLTKAELNCARLVEAKLTRANLSRANLFEADLSGADLTGARLFKTGFERANLEGATISDVSLEGVCLEGARLTGAKLRGISHVDAAIFEWIEADGARLEGVAARDWLRLFVA